MMTLSREAENKVAKFFELALSFPSLHEIWKGRKKVDGTLIPIPSHHDDLPFLLQDNLNRLTQLTQSTPFDTSAHHGFRYLYQGYGDERIQRQDCRDEHLQHRGYGDQRRPLLRRRRQLVHPQLHQLKRTIPNRTTTFHLLPSPTLPLL